MKTSSSTYLSNVIDLLLDAICVVDATGHFVFVSAACERIFGYTPEEMIGKAMIELVHPEDRERTLQTANEIMSGEHKLVFENRYLRKDGEVVHIMWSARWSEVDQLRIAVAHDITARKRAETLQIALYSISEAAHAAEDMLTLYQQIHQIIAGLLPASNFFVARYDNNVLSFPYYVDDYGQTPAPQNLDSNTLIAEVIRTRQTLLLTPETSTISAERTIEGAPPTYWLGVPLETHKGTIGALVVQSYNDDTRYSEADKELLQYVSTQVAAAIDRKQMHARLQYIAQYDPLTDLPNRQLLSDRLKAALTRAQREQDGLCLLYLDLDKFKQVNDDFGHATGDLLLQQVAERLKKCLRATDTIARVGGDEFVALLEKIQQPEQVDGVINKICSALDQVFDLNGNSVHISPSIGFALYPQHGDKEEQLLHHADEAMYIAKRKGGNQFEM